MQHDFENYIQFSFGDYSERVKQDCGHSGGLLQVLSNIHYHLLGVFIEQVIMLNHQEAMVILLKDDHEVE
jgi:hypothetical protein